jgi:CRISPR-associated exonuclease Cas4
MSTEQTFLAFAAIVLLAVAWILFQTAHTWQQTSGLPKGRVIYTDTGAWSRCEQTLFSERFALTGKPDYLIEQAGLLIPVEVKPTTAPPTPYLAHVLQLGAYCLLVEESYGLRPPHGILKYGDRAFEIDFTDGLRDEVVATLHAMRRSLDARDVHHSHDEPARCRSCGYRGRCEEVMS